MSRFLDLSVYPDVSLNAARLRRSEARTLIADGIDPAELRKTEKCTVTEARQAEAKVNEVEGMIREGETLPGSFKDVAEEWSAKFLQDKSPKYRLKQLRRLEFEVSPHMGNMPANTITAPVILDVLRRVEERGIIETTFRIKQLIGQIMRYAVVTGRAVHDPTPALSGALTPKPPVKHHAAPSEPREVARLLRIMADCTASPATRCAVELAPMLFCRLGELRSMEWADVNLEDGEWRYTATKKKRDQIVPLARQAVAALTEMQQLSGGGKYVFPGTRDANRTMSENTINKALKRLGIDTQEELTGHGLRAMARTVLREIHVFSQEAIELQINHKVIDPMGGAYDRTSFLPERKRMMQVWADYLDELTG